MRVIDVNALTKDYGSGRGVFDVSFHVDQGEVFGFLGPNGAVYGNGLRLGSTPANISAASGMCREKSPFRI